MMERELDAALEAARLAQKAILEVYQTSFDVEIKSDASPVTQADKRADEIIRATLGKAFPDDGFLTEESTDTPERFEKERIWIVDPVDGTKEFIARNGEFTTNIALCVDHRIVLGLIFVPVTGVAYYAMEGQGAYRLDPDGTKTRLHVAPKKEKVICLRSRSFYKEAEVAYVKERMSHFDGEPIGLGAALKFCWIAEGKADFFARVTNGTKEWDVAPGDLIVHEAGGFMGEPDGTRFTYNREDVYNRRGYAVGSHYESWMDNASK